MKLLVVALAFAASLAHAQDYPNKPIRILVPFAPGGAVDTTARVLAQAMQQRLNWQFVVENRPGGNGFIATTAVAKAAADGYTLLMAHTGEFAVNPALFPDVPYELERDFGDGSDCTSSTSSADLCSAGLPRQGVPSQRVKSDLYIVRLTDERVADDERAAQLVVPHQRLEVPVGRVDRRQRERNASVDQGLCRGDRDGELAGDEAVVRRPLPLAVRGGAVVADLLGHGQGLGAARQHQRVTMRRQPGCERVGGFDDEHVGSQPGILFSDVRWAGHVTHHAPRLELQDVDHLLVKGGRRGHHQVRTGKVSIQVGYVGWRVHRSMS